MTAAKPRSASTSRNTTAASTVIAVLSWGKRAWTIDSSNGRRAKSSRPETSSENCQGDLVVEIHAPPRGRDPAIDPADQARSRKAAQLGVEAGRRGHAVRGAQAQHQRLRHPLARVELFAVRPDRRHGGDVLAGPSHVPPAPGALTVRCVRVGARPRPVHGTAAPVRLVVTGLETGTRPARDLIAPV